MDTKPYIEKLTSNLRSKISTEVNEGTFQKVLLQYLGYHLSDKESAIFQHYYFDILSNSQYFLSFPNFFRQFKKRYALQGIDNTTLDRLEENKYSILELLNRDRLPELYFGYFANVPIKHGKAIRHKDLGSFFSKFVHTFQPTDYCALDNPIKNYLGLQKESFFIAFSVISTGYKLWAADNSVLVADIRQEFKSQDESNVIDHERMSDMKLLDLIFWSKANIPIMSL